MTTDIYVTRNFDSLLPLTKQDATKKRTSADEITHALGAMQSHFAELNALSDAVMRAARSSNTLKIRGRYRRRCLAESATINWSTLRVSGSVAMPVTAQAPSPIQCTAGFA